MALLSGGCGSALFLLVTISSKPKAWLSSATFVGRSVFEDYYQVDLWTGEETGLNANVSAFFLGTTLLTPQHGSQFSHSPLPSWHKYTGTDEHHTECGEELHQLLQHQHGCPRFFGIQPPCGVSAAALQAGTFRPFLGQSANCGERSHSRYGRRTWKQRV